MESLAALRTRDRLSGHLAPLCPARHTDNPSSRATRPRISTTDTKITNRSCSPDLKATVRNKEHFYFRDHQE